MLAFELKSIVNLENTHVALKTLEVSGQRDVGRLQGWREAAFYTLKRTLLLPNSLEKMPRIPEATANRIPAYLLQEINQIRKCVRGDCVSAASYGRAHAHSIPTLEEVWRLCTGPSLSHLPVRGPRPIPVCIESLQRVIIVL